MLVACIAPLNHVVITIRVWISNLVLLLYIYQCTILVFIYLFLYGLVKESIMCEGGFILLCKSRISKNFFTRAFMNERYEGLRFVFKIELLLFICVVTCSMWSQVDLPYLSRELLFHEQANMNMLMLKTPWYKIYSSLDPC
jgi:hypothetical protein